MATLKNGYFECKIDEDELDDFTV